MVHGTGLVGVAHALFVFVAHTDEREIYSPEGQELAWHAIEKLDALPIVHDVDVLLSRALSAKEPFFAVETYDDVDEPANRRAAYIVAADTPIKSEQLPHDHWQRLP